MSTENPLSFAFGDTVTLDDSGDAVNILFCDDGEHVNDE